MTDIVTWGHIRSSAQEKSAEKAIRIGVISNQRLQSIHDH